ncbi:S9 family peptidase [Chryseolinea sp. T2]|uniref:S9 family peptidase n=1 Tax=Chryseolinea sp. T2 TaxID=3129255 RepID=UPI00307728EC
MKAGILPLIIFIIGVQPTFAQDKKPYIVASDLMHIVSVNQINISPDGARAVAVVTRKKSKEDPVKKTTEYSYTQHLYLLDIKGDKAPVQLTYGDRRDGQPRWSPDGSSIAFVRADGDLQQIWILPMSGGEAFSVTQSKYGATQPVWSPDGKSLLFTSSIPLNAIEGEMPWAYERPGRKAHDEPVWGQLKESEKSSIKASPDGSLEDVRAWLAKNNSERNPRVLTRLDLQGEQDLDPEEEVEHLFVAAAQPGSDAKQITFGFQRFAGAQWSKDGKAIICSSTKFSKAPDLERSGSLWRMDADGAHLQEILKLDHKPISDPRISPDGKLISFVAGTTDTFFGRQNDLGVVPFGGGEATILTNEVDRDVQAAEWSADSKSLYFTVESEGDVPLLNISTKGGKAVEIIGGDLGVMNFAVGSGQVIYAQTETINPFEVYSLNLRDKQKKKLTSFNSWVADRKIGLPKEYWITRPDGTKVQYWILEPINHKEGVKYPTILNIHGGPTAMWGPSAVSMWHEFQLEAAWGYGVVFCNPRGSGGYGDAFKRGNFKDWGNGPAGDILASLEDAQSKASWIDKDQLVIEGGSYAGYMVAWIIGHDNRFKAANAQRGVYDLTTFMGEGNAWRLVPDYFGGYPWDPETKKLLASESPITYVDKIQTPLLIIHGDQDLRTGVIQSEMLYKSLKVLGKPVEYIRYPKEGHELTRSGNPGRMMDHLLRTIEFFERYVKHPEPPPATAVSN